MSKIIVGVLAMVGCCWLISLYLPSMWSEGFNVGGVLIRYAYFALGAVAYLAYRLKGK